MKTILLVGAFLLGMTSMADATVLFSDSLQTDLSQWQPLPAGNSGSAAIASAPGGGNALTFGHWWAGGDIFTQNTFTSATGSFTLTFDFLGNCGHTSQCGAFVFASAVPVALGSILLSDTPYTAVTQFPDSIDSWEQISYTFAGTSTNLGLELWYGSANFSPDSAYFRNMVLTDNAVGTPIGTLSVSVPEPSTWAMMLLGFCGIGFMLRKSRSLQPVATA